MKAPSQETSSQNALPVSLSGFSLINSPRLNKGTAFTDHERDIFDLHGLLPPSVGSLEEQLERRMQALAAQPTPFAKYSFLRDLQDTNETLFYALLVGNIEQMLPLVYTPTVGEGCQRFSEIWRKPRGLFLSYPNKNRIARILNHSRYDAVKCIVVSDGERILGLGDQGAGGMGIPIGKMALYTALGGIHPEHCLPILLDVGTDNEERLKDPIYIGWRSKRVRGQEYDEFVETFVSAVKARWPHVLLQWEDFAGSNAARLLARYRSQLCTFNDDIQGTAAITTATLISAMKVTGTPLEQQLAGTENIWHNIAKSHNLIESNIDQLVSAWHTDADLGRPIEVVTDMSKSRKLGFLDYQPTDDSFYDLFTRLRHDRIIP